MKFKLIRPGCRNKIRNIDIIISYLEGNTLKKCGIPYGLSVERTRQIVRGWMRNLLATQGQWLEIIETKQLRTENNIDLAKNYKQFLLSKGFDK